jgi:ATP-dependent RNA helicase DHX29
MSATVEARRFQEYFDNAPTIAVPGRTYPVQVQFLEDVVEATGILVRYTFMQYILLF